MGGPKVRVATPADLPAILDLVLRSMRKEPLWSYCFPGRTQHAGDHAKYTEVAIKQYLEQTSEEDLVVWVLDLPLKDQSGTKNASKIVSVALWDKSSIDGKSDDVDSERRDVLKDIASGEGFTTRKDASTSRILALDDAIRKSREKHLDRYGQQMYLHLLATHPEYQQEGYARALCKRAIEEAHLQGWAVSALASPTGYIFYSGLGFIDCGYMSARAAGDREEMVLKAMVAPPTPGTSRRPSLLGIQLPSAEGVKGSMLGLLPSGQRRASQDSRAPLDERPHAGGSRRGSLRGLLGMKP